MPTSTYAAEGTITTKHCGNHYAFFPKQLIAVKFAEGEKAWLAQEALNGKIRSVWIKKINFVTNTSTRPTLMYFDNLNAAFNESDLITHGEAVSAAIAYHLRRIQKAQQALEC
jgi:hypothetical protein